MRTGTVDVTAIIDALTAKVDYEPEVFIDINNGNAPVVVVYRGDSTGLLTPILLNPDGTPYTGVNLAFRIPSSGNLNVNAFPYCDAGTTKIKYVVTDNEAYLSDFAQLPDGTPTTISNTATVGSCELGDQLQNIEQVLTSIDSKIIAVNTGAVVVSSSALPSGASTSTNQVTANTSLNNIDVSNSAINGKIPSQIANRIPVESLDYGIDVARGNVPGVSFISIRGYNQANSTTNELIWAQSGTAYPRVTSAQTLTLSSSSALDTSAGTGARTVLVTYIEFSTGAEIQTVVTLNGLTGVTITTDGLAINGIRVLTAGSGGSNAGTIYAGYGLIILGVPLNMLSTVEIGKNNAQQAVYTVPAGKTLDLMSYRISASALSFIQLRTIATPTSISVVEFDIPISGNDSFNSVSPISFPAGYQLQFWGQANAGTTKTGIITSGYLR